MSEEISPLENHGWWMEQLRKDAKANRPEALRLADALDRWHEGVFPCEAAAELRRLHAENERLHRFELANNLWHEKTDWVRETAQPLELGRHRADVLKQRIERLHAVNAELLEALKSTHALLQAALIVSDAEARAIARQQLDVNRAAIAKAEGEQP
jgi:hypothetical protein